MKRHTWSRRLCALCCLLGFSVPAYSLRLDLVPSAPTIVLPGSTMLDLVVSDLTADSLIVSSYDIFLSYDDALISATAVSFGTELGGPSDSLQFLDLTTPGSIEVSELSLLSDTDLDALQGDSVTLASLTFSGLAEGTSSVPFSSVLMTGTVDPTNPGFPTELHPDLGGARIVVEAAAVPEPGTLLLLSLALGQLGVLFRARSTRRGPLLPTHPFGSRL